MSSIPLPALHVQAPQQSNVMDQFGQALALKNAMQQGKMRDLQMQEGNVELQQKQQQLKDQQAMTTAMQEWDGKDYNALPPLVMKHGASANAVMSLKSGIIEQQTKLAALSKDQLANLKARTDVAEASAQRVITSDPESRPAVYAQERQGLLASGQFKPEEIPEQYPGDQFIQMHAQAANATRKQIADVTEAQSKSQKGSAEAAQSGLSIAAQTMRGASAQDWASRRAFALAHGAPAEMIPAQYSPEAAQQVAQMGLTPHEESSTPVDKIEMKDWLGRAENKGKGPADFLVWKAKNSPTMMMMGGGNQLQKPEALDFAADNYRKTGQLPGGFTRSPQTTAAIIARAAELDKQAGGFGIAANKSDVEANRRSLDSLQKNFDQVSAFENTAKRNLDLMLQKAAKVPELGSRFADMPIRSINEKMLGTREMAEFRAALTTAQTETAKVLNSANASGVLSDSARKELEDIISGNLPYKSLAGQVNTFKQDMDNRHLSYQMQISDIRDRIRGAGSSGNQSAPKDGGKEIHYKIVNGKLVQQ